jgi:hypothetical protein
LFPLSDSYESFSAPFLFTLAQITPFIGQTTEGMEYGQIFLDSRKRFGYNTIVELGLEK